MRRIKKRILTYSHKGVAEANSLGFYYTNVVVNYFKSINVNGYKEIRDWEENNLEAVECTLIIKEKI